MKDDSVRVLKTVEYSAIAVGVLMLAGILTVMVLARGETGDDGDIAGVVAPALLLTCVSMTTPEPPPPSAERPKAGQTRRRGV
ncbi:MAG: hypothetical protein AB1806_06185 [Acidobacteriota bacterium]